MVAVSFGPYPVEPKLYDLIHSREAVAYHEAGHCVVARALSLEVSKLTLDCCRTRRRGENPISLWSEAVTALAGPMAERRFAAYPAGVVLQLRSSTWKTDYANAGMSEGW